MNTVYEGTLIEQPVLSRIESQDKDDTVQTRGAVPATIHEVLDRCERGHLPCNRRCLQLLFGGFSVAAASRTLANWVKKPSIHPHLFKTKPHKIPIKRT